MTDLPVSREDWAKTEAHKASTYSCRWCGSRFAMPHDVYDHLTTCEQAPDNRGEPAPEEGDDCEVEGTWVTYGGRSVVLSELEMQVMAADRKAAEMVEETKKSKGGKRAA